MKSFRKLMALLLAGIMVFSLVACSSNGGDAKGSEAPSSNSQTGEDPYEKAPSSPAHEALPPQHCCGGSAVRGRAPPPPPAPGCPAP